MDGDGIQPTGVCKMLTLVLMVFAFVLLLLAAFNVPSPPRLNLGWLGMALWALAVVLSDAHFPH